MMFICSHRIIISANIDVFNQSIVSLIKVGIRNLYNKKQIHRLNAENGKK